MIQATSGEGKRILDPPNRKYGRSATEKWEEKNGKTNGGQNRRKKKIMAEIVATMSLPGVYLCSEGPMFRGSYVPSFFEKARNIGPSEHRYF